MQVECARVRIINLILAFLPLLLKYLMVLNRAVGPVSRATLQDQWAERLLTFWTF